MLIREDNNISNNIAYILKKVKSSFDLKFISDDETSKEGYYNIGGCKLSLKLSDNKLISANLDVSKAKTDFDLLNTDSYLDLIANIETATELIEYIESLYGNLKRENNYD